MRHTVLKSSFEQRLHTQFTKYLEGYKGTQKEYALSDDAFDNFNRLAANLSLDRKKILLVYYQKHIDGIVSYINGNKSQRESVHGRIQDAVMYLMLLDGMIFEEEQELSPREMELARAMQNSTPTINTRA